MDVLISIKPQYVKQIVMNQKKYEYRKAIFKEKNISKIYIYSTAPDKVIIGYFRYTGYLVGTPSEIWHLTKSYAGLSKEKFFIYFNNKNIAYALIISNFKIYQNPINPYKLNPDFVPPQSYMYIHGEYLP